MFRYEILFLAVPEITKDESDGIKSFFSKAIRLHKGDMISFERWGKYRLAYPVKKNEYGVYFLTRFEINAENKNNLLAALKEAFVFKFNTIIMKSHVQKLDPTCSLEYRRPESLEDNPQDVDTFLKRHEMEGLLKRSPAGKYADRKNDKKLPAGSSVEVEENEDLDIVEDND